jgi:hypothetical protein
VFLWFVELTAIAATAVSIYAQNYAAMLFYGFVSVLVPLAVYRNVNRPVSDGKVDGKTRNDAIRAFLMWDSFLAVLALFWFAVSRKADGGPYVALALFCLACLGVTLALTYVMWRRVPHDYVYGAPKS